MQLYQPLRAANKPPAEPAVLIFIYPSLFRAASFALSLQSVRC